MSKTMKVVLTVAGALIVLGIIFTTIGALNGGMKSVVYSGKGGLSIMQNDRRMESASQNLNEFKNINIDVSLRQIHLVPADSYKIEYTYYDGFKPLITEKDGTLSVSEAGGFSKWWNNQSGFLRLFGWNRPKHHTVEMTLYYPQTMKFDSVSIINGAGDVKIKNLQAQSLNVELDLGDLKLEDIVADSLELNVDAGDCELKDTTADKATLSLDLGELTTKNFLTKGLQVDNNAGGVELEGTFTGHSIINCDLGDVDFKTTLPKESYNYHLNVDLGDVKVDNKKVSHNAELNQNGANNLEVATSAGDVTLEFGK